jgi:hypothetical protein
MDEQQVKVANKIIGLIKKHGSAVITTMRDDGVPYAYSCGLSKAGLSDFICTAYTPIPPEDLVRSLVKSLPASISKPTLVDCKSAGLGGDFQVLVVPLNTALDNIREIGAMSCNMADVYEAPWQFAQLLLPDANGHFPHEAEYQTGFYQPLLAEPLSLAKSITLGKH